VSTSSQKKVLLRPFGEELLDHITDDIIIHLMEEPRKAHKKLAKLIWNRPENCNFKLTDSHRRVCKVWDGSKWMMKSRDELFNSIILTNERLVFERKSKNIEIFVKVMFYYRDRTKYQTDFNLYGTDVENPVVKSDHSKRVND
jgi:hypothetical protein